MKNIINNYIIIISNNQDIFNINKKGASIFDI